MDAARMPQPGATKGPSRQDLLRIYEQTTTIAVVGTSANEHKATHVIRDISSRRGIASFPSTPRVGRSSVSACTPL